MWAKFNLQSWDLWIFIRYTEHLFVSEAKGVSDIVKVYLLTEAKSKSALQRKVRVTLIDNTS